MADEKHSDAKKEGEQLTRKCAVCSNDFAWDGADHKTLCRDCYMNVTRKCACGACISPAAKSWQTDCVACFKEKRQQHYEPCPYCPPEKKTHLRKRKGTDACRDCLPKVLIAKEEMVEKKKIAKALVDGTKVAKTSLDHMIEQSQRLHEALSDLPPPPPPSQLHREESFYDKSEYEALRLHNREEATGVGHSVAVNSSSDAPDLS